MPENIHYIWEAETRLSSQQPLTRSRAQKWSKEESPTVQQRYRK